MHSLDGESTTSALQALHVLYMYLGYSLSSVYTVLEPLIVIFDELRISAL